MYDGWNLIKELSTTEDFPTGLPASRVVDYYVWGLDLSGSLHGAGGIGGLLGRVRKEERFFNEQGLLVICHRPPGNPENCKTLKVNAASWPVHEAHGDKLGSCAGATLSSFLYTFDANGNVSELLQPTAYGPQPVVAHYEYSPFGELLVSTGPEAHDNPFRFSAKYFDSETALSYYGYRYYSPGVGRWMSRDPMGERGGRNLYAFVRNNSLNYLDKLGWMTYEDIEDKATDLNKKVKEKACTYTAPARVYLTISGTAAGTTISMTLTTEQLGSVISIDSTYWWDCFRAFDQAPDDPNIENDNSGRGWRRYGWGGRLVVYARP